MSQNGFQKTIEILLVEDNPADARLTKEAFREADTPNTIRVVEDGEQALAYLRKEGEFTGAVRPDIILLDLNLPKKDGREVLAEIKNDPDLRRIPVIVLTTSKSEADVLKSYDMHANCYVAKPVELDDFLMVIKSIEQFWLTFAVLPPE